MNLWEAAILGLVEGITEYLPISSTGHLVIATGLMGMRDTRDVATLDAVASFEIVIQGGAILAVVGLYWPRFVQMLRGLLGKDGAGLRLLLNLAIAFAPAAVIGKFAASWLKRELMHTGPVTAALLIGGVYMIGVEWWHRRRAGLPERAPEAGIESITPLQALVIGLLQCVAMIPGVSRSMMTITGGMFVGLRPAAAAEFSFLLGVPTLGAATVYSLYKDLWRAAPDDPNAAPGASGNMFSQLGIGPTLVGLVVAALSAALAVKWLVAFLNRHGLTAFGWYRIVLGLCLLGLALGEVISVG